MSIHDNQSLLVLLRITSANLNGRDIGREAADRIEALEAALSKIEAWRSQQANARAEGKAYS